MSYKNNPFLSSKDREKKEKEERNVYSDIIDQKIKGDYYKSLEGSNGQSESEKETERTYNALPPSPALRMKEYEDREVSVSSNKSEVKDNSFKRFKEDINKERTKTPEWFNKILNNTVDPIAYGYENTVMKNPLSQRIMTKSGETVVGKGGLKNIDGSKVEAKDSGKVGNFIADSAGTLLGMKSLNVGGESLLDATDKLGVKASELASRKLGNKLGGKVASSMIRGAVDSGSGEAALALANGENAIEKGLEGALGGAALFGAGKLGGELSSKVANKIVNVPSSIKNAEPPIPKTSDIIKNYGNSTNIPNIPNIPSAVNISKPTKEVILPKMPPSRVVKETPNVPNNNVAELQKLESKVELPSVKSEVLNEGFENLNHNVESEFNATKSLKESKIKTNTYKNSPFMQDDMTKKVVKDLDATYGTKTNIESFEEARAELNNNYQGVINRIKENGIDGSKDTVSSGIIMNNLIKKAKATGDTRELLDWMKVVRQEGTKLGQSIQAFSSWKDATPEGTLIKAQRVVDSSNIKLKDTNPKMYDKLLKENKLPQITGDDAKFILDSMEKIEAMPDGRGKDIEFAKVKKLMSEKVPSTFKDKLLAFQRINLLGNSKTLLKNIYGNVVMGGLENVKDIPASMLDSVISKRTGERTTFAGIDGQLQGMFKGAKETLQDAKLGISTSPSAGQYDLPSVQAFRKIENPKGVKDRVNNFMSGAEKVVNTGLELGDRPFYQGVYDSEIKKQLKHYKTTEVTEKMIENAKKVAEDRTFQNTSALVNGFKHLQKGLNFGKETGLGNVVLPFVKTPANILDKAMDYSPIGFIKAIITKMDKKGFDQKKFVDQVGRGITGSAAIALGYDLQKRGLLHGSGATDKDAKALEKQTGKLPYSIKTGNIYNTIDWAQPAAIPLMIGADISQNGGTKENLVGIISNAITSGGATLLDQSLFTGLADLFSGYSQSAGENIMEGVKKSGFNMLGQAVPFNSALNQVSKLTDKDTRSTYSVNPFENLKNKTQAKIPGLSKDLPQSVDTLGREVENNYGSKGLKYAFDVLANPGRTGKYNPSEAEKMALELYNSTGETKQIPRVADSKITYKSESNKKETINLSNRDVSEMQRIMGIETEKEFSKLNNSRDFQYLSDEDKAAELQKIMTDIEKEAKNKILDSKRVKRSK